MDLGAVSDTSRLQQPQFFTPEALQAALAALAPCGVPPQFQPNPGVPGQPGQTSTPQAGQPNTLKQHVKRKGTRAGDNDVSSAGPPRPPPIKHEVYEDLEEKFQQLQSEREPKRHRGNPKGYQIKSFCKNPACGKQLNGGRTNRCEHCGFDLASHRRNAQLERLIKSGPLVHTQARTVLRDAANEVHVRTGGKAMVLTLVYIEGAASTPAQAIAYGKPAAAFVESRKELITSFEAACRDHFTEQQQPQGQQPQPSHPSQQPAHLAPQMLLPGATISGSATAAMASALTSANLRAGILGPGGHLLGTRTTSASGPGTSQPSAICPAGLATTSANVAAHSVDLDAAIMATVADHATAIARCREARLSGDVLVRLPQAMQLTVLMQTGLLAGEAASVVVELESRIRLPSLPQGPPPPLLLQQPLQQQQQKQQQAPPGHQQQLQHQLHQAPQLQLQQQQASLALGPPGCVIAAGQQHEQQIPQQALLACLPAGPAPGQANQDTTNGPADLTSALSSVHGGGVGLGLGGMQAGPLTMAGPPVAVQGPAGEPLLAPLHAALMAAASTGATAGAGAGIEGVLLQTVHAGTGPTITAGQLQSLLGGETLATLPQLPPVSVRGLPG